MTVLPFPPSCGGDLQQSPDEDFSKGGAELVALFLVSPRLVAGRALRSFELRDDLRDVVLVLLDDVPLIFVNEN